MVSLHTAYHDATPLVMLVGQVERKDFGRLALQEQNYSRLLSDVTKSVIEVIEPEQASEAIARAFHMAESGTPGPVAVILPEDIFDEPTDAAVDQPRPRVYGGPRAEDLDRLADMLAKAERPLVWVGGALSADAVTTSGVRRSAPAGRAMGAAGLAHASPAAAVRRDASELRRLHGHPRPDGADREMKKADLLVAIGERITDSVSQSYTFPAAPDPQLPLVHVWPDANEIGRVLRPDLGIAAARRGGPGAAEARRAAGAEKRRGWVAGLNAIHRKLMAKEWEPTSDGVNFAAIVCEMDKHLAPDAAVTSDAGNFATFIHRYIGFRPGQMFLSSVVGAMGSGMPMAVAARCAGPASRWSRSWATAAR